MELNWKLKIYFIELKLNWEFFGKKKPLIWRKCQNFGGNWLSILWQYFLKIIKTYTGIYWGLIFKYCLAYLYIADLFYKIKVADIIFAYLFCTYFYFFIRLIFLIIQTMKFVLSVIFYETCFTLTFGSQ